MWSQRKVYHVEKVTRQNEKVTKMKKKKKYRKIENNKSYGHENKLECVDKPEPLICDRISEEKPEKMLKKNKMFFILLFRPQKQF